MRSTFLLLLAIVSFSDWCRADDILAKPLAIFSEKYATIAGLFERAKIQTNWNGFFLRADSQHVFDTREWTPSPVGLWVGVRTLPIEDLKSTQELSPTSGYIEKIVSLRFPKQNDGGDAGVSIAVCYGAQCNKKALSAVIEAIKSIKKEALEDETVNRWP